MVLKAFLSQCEPEKKRALERFLPEAEQILLKELPDLTTPISPEPFNHHKEIERVHWSWFLPTLKTYTEEEQKLFLSSLSLTSAKNLAKALEIQLSASEITPVAKSYLRQILLHSLISANNRLLPVAYLPKTPLGFLLNLSKKELTHLIDFLSLYDLSAELRQIVETKILKKIYSFLSEEEKKFLKTITMNKDPFSLGRIGMDRWDGSEESFRQLLHRRGLIRLSTALSGQHLDFIWYVSHQLDIGRGAILFKLSQGPANQGVTDSIIRQIIELEPRANP
jgi:hypothetical protein